MSYSFSVREATKEAALNAVRVKIGEVVAQQPVHETDAAQAVATAHQFIDMLADNEAADVYVSVNGSISTSADQVQSVSVGVNAALVPKDAPR